MSPQANNVPGLSLPQPSPHSQDGVVQLHSTMQPQLPPQHPAMPIEQPPITQYQTPMPAAPVISQPQPAMPMPQPSSAFATPAATTQMAAAPPEDEDESEDDDALDAEWVAKAKATIDQNRLDPFLLSNALSQVKADYMQHRYSKTIKVQNRPQ